jgi:ABC-type branched-subunit amino acid transport system substrate-binding protein
VDQGAETPARSKVMKALPAITDLVTLVTGLTARTRGRWQQPMLCLIGPGASAMLQLLSAARERQRPYAVPCAFADASQADDLRQFLIELAERWAAPGTSPERIRFRHFRLVDWLMRQDLTDMRPSQRESELARRLGRASLGAGSDTATEGARVLTGWAGFTVWLVTTILPTVLFRGLVHSRLVEVGRVYRWFMRQQYLAPKQAASFWEFALRLTQGSRSEEDPQQVDRLMVHAFLQDLRVEFRRRPWRVRAWRRTAYPVAMVDHVSSGNPGSALLSLINEVRNETGRTDPLLVVAAAQDTADFSVDEEFKWIFPLQGLSTGVEAWQRSLAVARRGQRSTAWYVPVEVPGIDRLSTYVEIAPPWRAAPPPFLARRRTLPGLAGLAVLVAAGGFGLTWHPDCTSLHKAGRVDVVYVEHQCIGYSDSSDVIFGNENLRKAQAAIFHQNREVERSKRRADRPYVTLVYFGSLTKPDAEANEETFSAEREELEGIQIAQHQANLAARTLKNAPLLRVLVANAGQDMRHAERVAGMLKELRERDPSIVAVLGLVESRTWTRNAMIALNDIGLPVVAPTLSGDDIGDNLRYYLQLAPPNEDQAKLIYEYATGVLGKRRILNYYSFGAEDRHAAESDIYVNTLREDLEQRFGQDNYHQERWNGQRLTDACAGKFQGGVVFFGGRYSNFTDFVTRLSRDCRGRLPILIADDSVNRYMANTEWRDNAPDNLPLAYVSKGSLALCGNIEDQEFRDAVTEQLGRCGPDEKPVGERVGLAYDAVQLLLHAVAQFASAGDTRSAPPSPAEVNRQVRILTENEPYPGVTGPIEFDGEGVVKDKYLALLCATDLEKAFQTPADVPFEVYHIGQGPAGETHQACHEAV